MVPRNHIPGRDPVGERPVKCLKISGKGPASKRLHGPNERLPTEI